MGQVWLQGAAVTLAQNRPGSERPLRSSRGILSEGLGGDGNAGGRGNGRLSRARGHVTSPRTLLALAMRHLGDRTR